EMISAKRPRALMAIRLAHIGEAVGVGAARVRAEEDRRAGRDHPPDVLAVRTAGIAGHPAAARLKVLLILIVNGLDLRPDGLLDHLFDQFVRNQNSGG